MEFIFGIVNFHWCCRSNFTYKFKLEIQERWLLLQQSKDWNPLGSFQIGQLLNFIIYFNYFLFINNMCIGNEIPVCTFIVVMKFLYALLFLFINRRIMSYWSNSCLACHLTNKNIRRFFSFVLNPGDKVIRCVWNQSRLPNITVI